MDVWKNGTRLPALGFVADDQLSRRPRADAAGPTAGASFFAPFALCGFFAQMHEGDSAKLQQV